MLACWFFVGAIGQGLPHRKKETVSELASGGTLLPYEKELSNDDAFLLAKAIQLTAVLVGFAAFVIAWKIGLRWYWTLLVAFGTYVVMGLLAFLALLGVSTST